MQRVSSGDARLRMPPLSTGKQLAPRQVSLLKEWVSQGAAYERHWAFSSPEPPGVPNFPKGSKSAAWVRSPIDAFVASRLERERLQPSPQASKETLIRRLSQDLTGMPPTPEEVDAFRSDSSADAYEKVVDRLLGSPRYGERLAAMWLDGARYADTNGYQTDGDRVMWRWRDWVIDAFNRDQPFDQFTVEQLAGDQLPRATLEQRIATGFNRNYRGNGEGGIIPEEYLVEYAVDRADTVGTVWLGVTAGCARCHDHKFDPLSQRDYYRFLAFFNNLPEKGRANKYGNSPPEVAAPTREQQAALARLDAERSAHSDALTQQEMQIQSLQASWESSAAKNVARWAPRDRLLADFPVSPRTGTPVPAPPAEAAKVGDFGFLDRFSFSLWVRPEGDGTLLSRMLDEPRGEGYSLAVVGGKLQAAFVKRWLDDSLRLTSQAPLPSGKWSHVVVSYDGTRTAAGVQLFVNGARAAWKVDLDELNQSFNTEQPFRLARGGGPASVYRGGLSDVRVYGKVLTGDEIALLSLPDGPRRIATLAPASRTRVQSDLLRRCFLESVSPPEIRSHVDRLIELELAREKLVDSFPTVMVMEDASPPRKSYILKRGQYDKPGEEVTPGIPSFLPALVGAPPRTRLELARWLVHPRHPLTARVMVNRIWQMVFGVGLVRTPEDFGAQGDWPVHRELLDFLATRFVSKDPKDPDACGWSIKKLLKLIVSSSTYRQESRLTPELRRRDPDNRLLARAPRIRLSAEMVRDQALSAAGLLVERVGGPSVRPYQPAGLWTELAGGVDYAPDKGEGLYRRSLYTFWKRTSPPPAMSTFDAAGREACVVRQTRTHPPLQALNLLTAVTDVEAARVLAARAVRESAGDERPRVTRVFRRVLGRAPSAAELAVLTDAYQRHYRRFTADPKAASALLAVGDSPPSTGAEPAELAALASVASMVLNLDEAVTRE